MLKNIVTLKLKTGCMFIVLTTVLSFTSTIIAQDAGTDGAAPPDGGQNIPARTGGLVNAINALSNKIESLSTAGAKSINQAAYEVDESLTNLLQINPTESTITTDLTKTVAVQNQLMIKQYFHQFPNNALTYSSSQQKDVTAALDEKKARDGLIDRLTLASPASDTLWSAVNNVESATYYTTYPVTKPQVSNDCYFDYSCFFTPMAYTLDQAESSYRFINYITQYYQDPTAGINLSKLQQALNQYQNDPTTLGEQLENFRSSQAYKTFQLNLRSAMASKSIALNIFNEQEQERIPILKQKEDDNLAAISQIVGVTPTTVEVADPNNPNKKVKMYQYASPLQISNYTYTHRMSDSNWYKQIDAASPPAIQRESLTVLAEIENQLQRQYLSNEKLMAILASVALQGAQANAMLAKTSITDINSAIDTIAGSATTTSNQQNAPPPSSSTTTAPPPSTDTTSTSTSTSSSSSTTTAPPSTTTSTSTTP